MPWSEFDISGSSSIVMCRTEFGGFMYNRQRSMMPWAEFDALVGNARCFWRKSLAFSHRATVG